MWLYNKQQIQAKKVPNLHLEKLIPVNSNQVSLDHGLKPGLHDGSNTRQSRSR